ncbi:MAG: sulfur carrier protein ThiS [cyanobacterium endosymbiont of Rhopalodia musculus]|uniref:sulfur carrier protein ThiS n=1 Tax=cyanobacterium endosymbiont of Epithemia clementina EcSB TaxID=3034674 RepID=UPI00248147B6|nr:sulfur carrier protein ThiS [cyanobacterium endosymbiont of Epithemia clementina EcSB]WGT68186.1 sulfur carrier protein ThiS [cyanobacterium endosymbiont of Epithemia clementina EcSB]
MSALSQITLQVNGTSTTCSPNMALPRLLEKMGLNPRLVAVEYNGEILHRQYWDNTQLRTGDRLEIVTIVGGGSGS